MPFLLPNLDFDDHRRPPNTLMIYCSENYARTITLVHQNSRRCIQIISGTSPSDVSSTAWRRTWTYQIDVLPPNLSWLHIWEIGVSNLLWDIFMGVLMTGKRSCCLMNLPFSACPAANKGHFGAKIDPWILLVSSSQYAQKSTDFRINVIKDRGSGYFLRP